MSRFIKYASNLLDGVDNIAKDSLIDQDIAAAAAGRRRRRRQQQRRESQGAEQSEGGMSEDSAQYDTPGEGMRARRHGGGRVMRPRTFDELGGGGGSFADDGVSTADEDAVGSQAALFGLDADSAENRSHSAADFPTSSAAGESQRAAQVAVSAATSTTTEPGIAPHPYGAGATVPSSAAVGQPSPGGEKFLADSASTIPGVAFRQRQQQERQRAVGDAHGAPVGRTGGAPGKEDGSGWSDQDTFSSAAPSPLAQGDEQEHPRRRAGSGGGDPTIPPSRPRPMPLEIADIVSEVPSGAKQEEGDGGRGQEGNGEEGGATRETPENEADNSGSANVRAVNVKPRLSPAKTPLRNQQAHEGPGKEFGGVSAGVGGGGGGGGDFEARGRADSVGRGVGGAGAGSVGSTGAAAAAAAAVSAAPLQGAPASPSSARGRERQGLGNLLRMGVQKVGRHGGDTEALKAEAANLRAEVEELSLELEDAEDRLSGQETELKTAAEKLKRHKATTLERERELATEMEEFRALQVEEKKVFLANLEGMERTVKEKGREADEARVALSALEAFAMEREDTAARLTAERDELLQELKGARSGQDRSAEEVREALTRAEARAEEVEARHRAWMRQAQARQTELEANAAQLAEALAEANRKLPAQAEGTDRGPQAASTRKVGASDRELRAYRDELDSCQASLELEQERTRSLQQEVTVLRHDLDASRATEVVVERQRQEHVKMAADSFAKASRLEEQLRQEKASAQRLGASAPLPAGAESQIQSLSSKLLDKQARLEESVCERATLSAKLKEASGRAFRAEQELREARGDSLEGGGDDMRSRKRPDRQGGGRVSPTGSWSRLAPIAKHKKIATAVDVLDRHTLQAVVFLRTSSVARASFLGYLLLLHLWAFVILGFHSSNLTEISNPAGLPGNGNDSE